MKLSRLIAVDRDVEITGIAVDSRKVQKGNLFICLSGDRFDGHDFAAEALKRGAAVIVTEKPLGIDGEICLPDTRRACASLYATWYGNPQKDLKIYGVTGTNGKTSVVSLLNQIYRKAGVKTATSGTLGSFWDGVAYSSENTTALPETLYRQMREMVNSGVRCLFMEVSSHALALERVSEIEFAYAVYTNLTPEHLDFHKTMEQYAAAKEKLFEQARVGIFNYDDKYSYIASQRCPCRSYGYGRENHPDFAPDEVLKEALDGMVFTMRYRGEKHLFSSPLAGGYNLYNLLAAISTAMVDGIDASIVASALASFEGVRGRLERIYSGDFTVLIDYAHTPDALMRVLEVLRSGNPKRLRVLFGCGGDRDRTKRAVMGEIAKTLADDVIVTSDNARSEDPHAIIEEILSGMKTNKTDNAYKVIENRRMALEYAIDTSLPGDVLLVAGKGHEEYEIDCYGKHPFSETKILLARLRERGYL